MVLFTINEIALILWGLTESMTNRPVLLECMLSIELTSAQRSMVLDHDAVSVPFVDVQ